MRSHLLIQGPLVSFFTKYCPPQPGPDLVSVRGQPAFNSAANIARMAEAYRHRFDTIVLSTWDEEELPNQAHLESLGVVICRCSSQSVRGLPNHYKQVVGVLAGVKAIGTLAAGDRITKTRTDLWFDLPGFIDHAERADQQYPSWRDVGQLGFIHSGNSRGPFFLEDMFITARAQDFGRFWESSLPERQQLAIGIHESLPLEYAWQHREQLRIPKQMFWDFYRWVTPWHNSAQTLLVENKLWRYLLLNCFCFSPELAETEFLWRGGPSTHETNRRRLKRYQFFEQWELLRDHPAGLSQLTDLSYFEGRKAQGLKGFLSGARRAMRVGKVLVGAK